MSLGLHPNSPRSCLGAWACSLSPSPSFFLLFSLLPLCYPGLVPTPSLALLLYILGRAGEECARPGLGPLGLTHTVQTWGLSFNHGSTATWSKMFHATSQVSYDNVFYLSMHHSYLYQTLCPLSQKRSTEMSSQAETPASEKLACICHQDEVGRAEENMLVDRHPS